jgi:hypothetical protein
VGQHHHIIDIRVIRQQFGFDAFEGEFHGTGDALHAGGNRQNVLGADAAIPIAEALKGVTGQGFARRRRPGRQLQPLQRRRRDQANPAFIDPIAAPYILVGSADDFAIADNRRSGGDVVQRHLVALGHEVVKGQAVGKFGTGG